MSKFTVPIEKLYPILIYIFTTGKLPSKDSYEERLLWQKVGYLAQQLGASLDEYKFNWYKAGPYSPSYTSLLYNSPNYVDELNNYILADYTREKLLPLKEIYSSAPKDISIPRWFELVASILYIKRESKLEKEAVFKSLIRKKPFFNEYNINNQAWDLLVKLNML